MSREWGWNSIRNNRQAWKVARLEALLLVALLLTLLLVHFATHPGLHVAGVTVLLDLMIWKREPFHAIRPLIVILLLNLLALLVIAFGNDPVELWLTAFYGIYIILLLVVTRSK